MSDDDATMGGASAPQRTRVLDGALDVGAVVRAVEHPSAGAVVTFVGTVRDHADGRAVVSLEYHAYRSMAEAELERVLREVERELPGTRLEAQHRVGHLAIGDAAVVCAASAAHRDRAFEACRALIDRIKARVPIWKREHDAAGASWVGWPSALTPAEAHAPAAPAEGREPGET